MTHDFELRDPSGNLLLRPSEALSRIVHVEELPANFTGTISVPSFDDQRGLFYVTLLMTGPVLFVVGETFPTLSWNNTTKVMTISPHTLPSGFPQLNVSPFILVFLHVSGITVI